MKKFLSAALALCMSLTLLAGCGSEPAADAPAEGGADVPKVALILEGPISDMSWNATAYNGLKMIEELGAEVSYQENVPVASLADSITTYANDGYDLIYLSTSTYEDAGLEAAANFPDTQFVLINGKKTADNVTTLQIADEEQGFMLGVVSALVSEAKNVGFVGAMEITPIINGGKGFEQGVAYVNNGTQSKVVMTGSFEDVNKAKETAKALLDSGIDVVAPMADQAGLGVVGAAEEAGKLCVASGIGFEDVAPNSLTVSVVKDTAVAYEASYKQFLEGTLPSDIVKVGAAEGVVYLTDWSDNAAVTDEVKAEAARIYEELAAGNIEINLD